ncbi:aldehyde dehydrogenase family protein [Candidatus Marsarchaeota archaeon]|nr:aldehyde dehydrogenase family protein [Candidatus Marsarchaeota archaeon]
MPKRSFPNESTYKRFVESGRESEFDRLFDEAAESVKAQFGKKYPMYIDGKEVLSSTTITERSPIDNGMVIGHFQKGTREHARQAIKAANNAFETWKNRNYKERVALFRNAAEVFSKNKFPLAAILSYENGKTRYESIGEVDEAIDFMRYYANELEANKGYSRKTSKEESKTKVAAGFQGAPSTKPEKVDIRMEPFGVFGIIAPFNFPVSISTGMSTGAMITGNTVVFKPSSSDSMTLLTGLKIYEYLKEAGIPDGVFNYVSGPGAEVGDELVVNPDVAGIAFTGSRTVGTGMITKAYGLGLQKTFIVEMGGKNPAIVSRYATLDDAVSGVASAAFGFDGQKCSACSRVYVHESIKEQFVSNLIEKARSFKIGNPLEKEIYMGPLISENAQKVYSNAVEKAKSSGRVLYGGNIVNTGLNGYYVEPTIIEVNHDNELVHNELFVPILTIEGYKDFDEAIKLANDVPYGLTAALYSKKNKEVKEFIGKIQAGTIYINRYTSATTGAIVGLHTFVGWKGSSINGKGSGSRFYLQQFLREQSVSITK